MIKFRQWQTWKFLVAGGLVLLLAVDLGLAIFLWQSGQRDPETLRSERDRLAIQAKLLKADVQRGQQIRAALPQTGKDCDAFYKQTFLDASSGYSHIESDLDAIAAQAGVKTSGYSFKQTPVKDRGVTEVTISTSVAADYPSIIHFINGLERSKNFYLLDNLHLATATLAGIHLDLELHTYFRT
jgi:Tfp pilus assembly protein PilO